MSLSEERYTRMVEKSAVFRAPRLSVECADFHESIPRHTRDFLYCDPPCYLDEGKTFCGLYPHRNFPIHPKGFRHNSETHYQEVRFNINKHPCVTLLLSNLPDPKHYSEDVLVYGVAKKTFGNWHKPEKGEEV